MRLPSAIPHRNAGFTLVEAVVAIAIFAVVLMAVGSSFRAVSDATRRTQNLSDTYQTARIVLGEITKNVHNFYPYLAMLPQASDTPAATGSVSLLDASEQEEQAFIGIDETDRNTGWDMDRISFVAVSSDDLILLLNQPGGMSPSRPTSRTPRSTSQEMPPRFDLIAVTYFIGTDPSSSRPGLMRVINWLPGLGAEEEEETEVTLLSDQVRSLNVRYFDPFLGEWVDEWQEATYFPTAVMVTVGVERADRSGELFFLSNVTSLPMGGEAPEGILAALEEMEEEAALEGETLGQGAGGPEAPQ